MFFICSTSGIHDKYGAAGDRIIKFIGNLGQIEDVSGLSPEQTQAHIAALPAGPACLMGGYDLIAPFLRDNPSKGTIDDDTMLPTDAPYGATPGNAAEEFAPTRPISRIPDGNIADPAAFLALLGHQHAAPTTATPPGSFEVAAAEFSGPMGFVHAAIPGANGPQHLSPPDDIDTKGLTAELSHSGRIHVILHGSNFDPDWARLWGHDGTEKAPFVRALSSQLFDLCDLRGAIVTFSSCYAAMLDVAPATDGMRTYANQVALTCLQHGAKVVYGATRANWIDTIAPYDAFGPGLVAQIWSQLAAGKPAAEALMLAKSAYLKLALSETVGNYSYAKKTVLQAHCYGHPASIL